MQKLLILALFSLTSSLALAAGSPPPQFGQGDYSTDGTGKCYVGSTACQDVYTPKKAICTWEECISNGGPISWRNSHGMCLYNDPNGD